MKIIFMGTPEFSCPTLKKLLSDSNFEIVAVYTRAPQIAGRGHKLQNSPIHELALKHGLKVVTPKTLRDEEIKKEFLELKADAAAIVAYGLILPPEILAGTKFGCINIHPSLLPRWRGAAPIQRTIMSGDKETGINIIKMNSGIDSGDVICEEKFSLNGRETYANLATKLAEMGAEILVKTLKNLRDGKVALTRQNHALATYAKKIEKAECEIDWKKSAEEIERKIRALNGSLGAFFIHNGEKIKIFSAEILYPSHSKKSNYDEAFLRKNRDGECGLYQVIQPNSPSEFLPKRRSYSSASSSGMGIDKNSCENEAGKILDEQLSIQCGRGIIRPTMLQREGKRPMPVKEFLLGFKI